jgi:uncharacterized protein (DUF849 family)
MTAPPRKVIISCAVTGSIHTPSGVATPDGARRILRLKGRNGVAF